MTMTPIRMQVDLSGQGLAPAGTVVWQPTTAQLYTAALKSGAGALAHGGPLVVDTGKFTGRSPQDKFVVAEPGSEQRIWWGEINKPLSEERFDGLRAKVVEHLEEQDRLYVVDAFAGADPAHRIEVRVITGEPVPRALREDDVHHAVCGRGVLASPRRRRPPRPRGRGGSRRRRHAHRHLRRPPPE